MRTFLTPGAKKPCVIVMVKEPRPGRVKTRLGRDIGMLEAAAWYRRHVAKQLSVLCDPRWTVVAALAPKQARIVPGPAEIIVDQGQGDLGRRMIGLLRQAPPKSVLIGSDILDVGPKEVAHAMALLADHDAVLGPSPDGGFWLIGFRHPRHLPPGLLDGARWSTPHAMADTQARLPGRVALAGMRNDVDTIDDLP